VVDETGEGWVFFKGGTEKLRDERSSIAAVNGVFGLDEDVPAVAVVPVGC
jgi:hypothetical protein